MKVYKTRDIIGSDKRLCIFYGYKPALFEPTHTHDFIEIIYVLAGEAEQIVDGCTYRVRHGDMIFLNYGCAHSFTPTKNYAYINICFSPETVVDSIISRENAFSVLSLTSFHEMCAESNGGKISFFGKECKEIEDVLTAMLKEFKEKKASWSVVLECYLNILITKMLRKVEAGIGERELGEMWQKLSEYIETNFDTELTLSSLAQKCFYNPSYFSRVFKEKFKMSPVEYVTRKRLNHALKLLSETELSVDEIGERSGFSDRSNFYRAFSKYVGGKPTDYRRGDEKVKKIDK